MGYLPTTLTVVEKHRVNIESAEGKVEGFVLISEKALYKLITMEVSQALKNKISQYEDL